MAAPLHESLFAALLARSAEEMAPQHRARVASAADREWEQALFDLVPHKVIPLLSNRLRALGLMEVLTVKVQQELIAEAASARAVNSALLLATASILRLARDRAEPQLLVKGILLADSYYPELGARPMSDVDIVARPGHHEALFRLLEAAGFEKSAQHALQEDGVTYVNRAGLLCDAHRVLRMFSAWPWESIVRESRLEKLRGVKILSLEPNAMVAHLAVHMTGHLREVGPVLLWIVDILFVLRRHHGELDAARVRTLCGDEAAWVFLLRVCRLLQEWGEPLPDSLSHALHGVPPVSLGAIMRQRRLTPWGLPGPLGWARLLLACTALRDYQNKPSVRLDDVLLWPADELMALAAPWFVRKAS